MKDTQISRLIAYFSQGRSITSLDAFRLLGITRLAARIHDLEKKGVPVIRERILVKNRYDEDCRVVSYSCPSMNEPLMRFNIFMGEPRKMLKKLTAYSGR